MGLEWGVHSRYVGIPLERPTWTFRINGSRQAVAIFLSLHRKIVSQIIYFVLINYCHMLSDVTLE